MSMDLSRVDDIKKIMLFDKNATYDVNYISMLCNEHSIELREQMVTLQNVKYTVCDIESIDFDQFPVDLAVRHNNFLALNNVNIKNNHYVCTVYLPKFKISIDIYNKSTPKTSVANTYIVYYKEETYQCVNVITTKIYINNESFGSGGDFCVET